MSAGEVGEGRIKLGVECRIDGWIGDFSLGEKAMGIVAGVGTLLISETCKRRRVASNSLRFPNGYISRGQNGEVNEFSGSQT